MSKIPDLIEKLQKQPYETRIKIMWGTVVVAGIILLLIWIVSLKSTIRNASPTVSGSKTSATTTPEATSDYASVERIDASGSNLKIYFNFNNTTNDILDLPTLTNISLSVGNQQINPTQITDRQGQLFVQKILSNTQNFGILIFPKTDGDNGELDFNQMFFEQNPSELFSQKIQLNFKQLETTTDLRD